MRKARGAHFELGFYYEISAAVPEVSGIDSKNRGCRYSPFDPDRDLLYSSAEFQDPVPEAGS